MENNLPTNSTNQTGQGQMPQQSVPAQPVPLVAAQPPSPMPQQAAPVNKSHIMRTLLIMIAIFLLVILSIYIYISFVNKQQLDSSSIQIENTISPAPKSAQITDEQELNSIVVGDVDADLQEIDTDLNNL